MRYFPQTPADITHMLKAVGADSIEELFSGIPEEFRPGSPPDIGPAVDEIRLERIVQQHAAQNRTERAVFRGGGTYDHFIPAVVDNLSSRSEFYTAYTPYQPEASQGHLRIFFEYQTMICKLTGMDISNASMYDGGSALAEGALMACRLKRKCKKVVAVDTIHPNHLEVLKTYLRWTNITLEVTGSDSTGSINTDELAEKSKDAAVVIFQVPDFYGSIPNGYELTDIIHKNGAYACVSVDPVSLGVIAPPADYGADIITGEGQPLGNPMYFGGHGFGIFAASEEFTRKIPGRIVGKTVDRNGTECCVLTLQTREQHIRRDRATSNICSNQAWCVTRAVIYMAAMGPAGMRRIGEISSAKTHRLARECSRLNGYSVVNKKPFFKEFVLRLPIPAARLNKQLEAHNILGGLDLGQFSSERADEMLVCVTEKRTDEEIEQFINVLSEVAG